MRITIINTDNKKIADFLEEAYIKRYLVKGFGRVTGVTCNHPWIGNPILSWEFEITKENWMNTKI